MDTSKAGKTNIDFIQE